MKKIDWHAGFVSAIKLELREYEDILTYEEEHLIANRAQKIDLLIIKDNLSGSVDNPIGRIFNLYNVFEYKGIGDILTYGDFYKTLAYTSLYLYENNRNGKLPKSSYTMIFVRYDYPKKLFRLFKRDGIIYTETEPGFYYVEGMPFKTQIIISGQTEPGTNIWLKSLTNRSTKEDLQNIIDATGKLNKKYKDDANNVMDVFGKANRQLVQVEKKNDDEKEEKDDMNELIRILYGDEIEKQEKEKLKKMKKEMQEKMQEKMQKEVQEKVQKEIAKKDKEIDKKDKQIIEMKKLLAEHNIKYEEA